MKYNDIIKVLFLPENESVIPDGIAYSEAMCEIVGNKLLDSFFLYTITDMRSKAIGPIAKISVDTSIGKVVNYFEYENPKKFAMDNKYDDLTVIKALNSYETFYPELRKIYFIKKYSAESEELLMNIINCFKIFSDGDMINIYNEVFPETMKFIKECDEKIRHIQQ